MAVSQIGAGYASRAEIVDPAQRRALDDLASQIKSIADQVNATPAGHTPAPPRISSLAVTAADGIFDAQIQDNNPIRRGLEYFLEYSLNASFPQPVVIHLGATRNWRAMLGNQTLYFRAYSQYATSEPSAPVYFGSTSTPTAVVGGGAAAGPAPQPSAGSGTAPSDGRSGGSGYGKTPARVNNSKRVSDL